jgi:hypothetical protein
MRVSVSEPSTTESLSRDGIPVEVTITQPRPDQIGGFFLFRRTWRTYEMSAHTLGIPIITGRLERDIGSRFQTNRNPTTGAFEFIVKFRGQNGWTKQWNKLLELIRRSVGGLLVEKSVVTEQLGELRSRVQARRDKLELELLDNEKKFVSLHWIVIERKDRVLQVRRQPYTKYGLDTAEDALIHAESQLGSFEDVVGSQRAEFSRLGRFLRQGVSSNAFSPLGNGLRPGWTPQEVSQFLSVVMQTYGPTINKILSKGNPSKYMPEDLLEGKELQFEGEVGLSGYRIVRTRSVEFAVRGEGYQSGTGICQFMGVYVGISGEKALSIAIGRGEVSICPDLIELAIGTLQSSISSVLYKEHPD